jgi:hypothetical protein
MVTSRVTEAVAVGVGMDTLPIPLARMEALGAGHDPGPAGYTQVLTADLVA